MACSLSADRNVICRTKSISSLTIREVFNFDRDSRWLVPVFQRRYCWGKDQVRRLLSDSVNLCSQSPGSATAHSLGRIVVHCKTSGNILLIDGQQRLTTTSLFISAIRDFIFKILESSLIAPASRSIASLQHLAELCHEVIYSTTHHYALLEPSYYDRESYARCIDYNSRDEEKFQRAFSDSTAPINSNEAPGMVDHILQNRAYFDGVLADGSLCGSIAQKLRLNKNGDNLGVKCSSHNLDTLISVCRSLIGAVLDSFTLLYFETEEHDICSVYERLAMREAALAQGFTNKAPGVTLAEADLARNLITSFGCTDAAQIELYQKYWAPIEQKAMHVEDIISSSEACPTSSANTTTGIFPKNKCHFEKLPVVKRSSPVVKHTPKVGMTGHLNACLQAFMNQQSQWSGQKKNKSPAVASKKNKIALDPASQWTDPGETLFPMYSGLKTCIREALKAKDLPISMHSPTPEAEAAVSHLLAELLSFATTEYNWEE